MCGIAVTIDLPHCSGAARDAVVLDAFDLTEEMVKRLRPRGPDDESIMEVGSSKGPKVVLGHTRLAIVGGMEAKSSFVWTKQVDDDGTKTMAALVHNGEAYNYKQLKQQLMEEEHCQENDFTTECDSEVLLACCVFKGVEWTLRHARGMFAFVLVEWLEKPRGHGSERQSSSSSIEIHRVVAARDTFGIKPLVCAIDSDRTRFVFASQTSAIPIEAFSTADIQVDDILPGHHVEYTFHKQSETMRWNCTSNAHLFISNEFDRKNILPGHRIERITDSLSYEQKGDLDDLRAKLIDAVECRMPPAKGAIKTAVLLSGGLDSSLITSIAAGLVGEQENLYTFNISFQDDIGGTDQAFARLVQEHLPNVQHEEVSFTFQEGLDAIPHVIDCLETYDAVSIRAGVPLYLLSKHIKARGFKVVLCGEGADEVFAGYRLFESYQPQNQEDVKAFCMELSRRLENIDTSELQRVDRCTSAHGLEARVPFLDLAFVATAMQFPAVEKMSHVNTGRIQKYILRLAFNETRDDGNAPVDTPIAWLPDAVLFREKEQLADGIGRGWIELIQNYATESEQIQDREEAEKILYKKIFERRTQISGGLLPTSVRLTVARDRQQRRHRGWPRSTTIPRTGVPQSNRWYPVLNDTDIMSMKVNDDDVNRFLIGVLGWSNEQVAHCKPTLGTLNRLIVSMLERVPFHNLTLLLRERRPPTVREIKEDMLSGLGGPCSVVNTFFAALLVKIGFGYNVYLLSCKINGRTDCHVALLVQVEGLRYFVDVANAKPYSKAVCLGDYSVQRSLNSSFEWNLCFVSSERRMQLLHFGKRAQSFDPTKTVRFQSFRDMIWKSRSDPSFGPFLTGLRFCLYSDEITLIKAVRDSHIYDGRSTKDKRVIVTRDEIRVFAEDNFSFINGFPTYVSRALEKLDDQCPGWFERSRADDAG